MYYNTELICMIDITISDMIPVNDFNIKETYCKESIEKLMKFPDVMNEEWIHSNIKAHL